MKELSIEEKAQRYDEAFKVIKECVPDKNGFITIYPQEIFPELKESGDDKVRKKLIHLVKKSHEQGGYALHKWESDEMLAWVEKQGEKESVTCPICGWEIEKQGGNLVKNGYINNKDFIKYADKYSHEIWHKLMDNFKNIKDYHIGCNDVSDIVLNAIIDTCNWLEKQNSNVDNANKEYWRGYREGKQEILDKYVELEKQGEQKSIDNLTPQEAMDIAVAKCFDEQKPDDKVEPKFHKGDWTVSKLDRKARQISEVHFDEYNSYYVVEGKSVNLEEYDRLHHLWTFKDAKDGDVLLCEGKHGQEIGIVKQYFGKYGGCDKCFETYCFIDWDGIFRVNEYMGSSDIHPATKEQRDTLIKAMTDAGYTFDFEKKELKKIEQNPIIKMKTPEESLGISSEEYNKIIDECVYGDGKSTWGKEDEQILNAAILHIKNENYNYYGGYSSEYIMQWLKSLKDRVQPQPRQEWSEEDENRFRNLIYLVEHSDEGKATKQGFIKFINRIKSLRPQKLWKPSEMQLDTLEQIIDGEPYDRDLIIKLFNDLKKL